MLPDLSSLSREEAALITDVLSQLSIGNAAATSIAPQSTPSHGSIPDAALAELDLAAWTIEQELRGLHGQQPQAPQPELFPHEPYRHTNPHFQGSSGVHDACPPDVFNGAPQTPQNPYGAEASYGRWPHPAGNQAEPSAADLPLTSSVDSNKPLPALEASQQPHRFDTSARALTLTSIGAGPGADGILLRQRQQDSAAVKLLEGQVSTNSSSSPLTAQQPVSLLKEMRERLRQQQSQQQAFDGAPDVDTSRASSVNGSVAYGMGPKASAAGQIEHASRGGAVSAGGGSPSSVAAGRKARPLPSTPSAIAKAFTMLNARTSIERYGPEPGLVEAHASTPTKPVVKVPEPERSVRLQQLYERTAEWRRRCEERYAKVRHDREASELEGCTFTPMVSTASHLIVQGKSTSEAYLEVFKGGTPTKHIPAPDTRPSASTTTSSRTTPLRSAGGIRSPIRTNTPTGSRTWISGNAASVAGSAQADGSAGSVSGERGSVSPPRPVVNGAEVGERLYQHALEQRARQEARIFQQLLEEERQRRFMASVQSVSPRVYNPPEPSSSRHLPTGMEECTFHPRTRFRLLSSRPVDDNNGLRHRFDDDRDGKDKTQTSSWRNTYAPDAKPDSLRSAAPGSNRRPKSAPHMRGVAGRSNSLFNIYAPSGFPATLGRGPASMNFNLSPDLDWEEFLARQDRFLVTREQKIALLEQSGSARPRMSVGSKKLLKERALRRSTVGSEGSADVQGEASTRNSNSSPTEGKRVKTIMEMYKECTFQPQITRRASLLPGRQLEDFVDGGRARHEEWRQQQQAVKEMREAEELTFRPSLSTKDAYPHVRPRISLKNPEAYLALVADKRKQREAQRADLESERQAREMQQCTFKPRTTPLPSYLIRRLQEQHLEQLRADQSVIGGESSGDLGDADSGVRDGNYLDTEHEAPIEFRHSMGVSGAAASDQATDVQDSKAKAFRDAYQRALNYATSHGKSAA